MDFKAIIFDLDGTLLNTLDDLSDSMNEALQQLGFPTHPVEDYKIFIGDGVDTLVRRTLPKDKLDPETIDKTLGAMKKNYQQRWDNKTKPYAGIPELLDELEQRDIKKAIFSNKPHDFTLLVVEKLLPRWSFDIVLGHKPPTPKKPNPTAVFQIAEQLKINPEQFLYIGDTDTDMKTAVAAEMFPVGVLWGFRSAEELKQNGAKFLAEEPDDILQLLQIHLKRKVF